MNLEELGRSEKIQSDRKTQFAYKKCTETREERSIRMILTSIRHPQANMVERVNRELARLLRTLLTPVKHGTWYSQIVNIETIVNEIYHDTTETTAYELSY